MKQKKIALLGVAAVAALGLASCGGNTPTPSTSKTPTPSSTPEKSSSKSELTRDTLGLDVYVDYVNKGVHAGITLVDDEFVNDVESKSYSKGDLLPVWKVFQDNVKTTFRDACAYSETDNNKNYDKVKTAEYKSITNNNQYIDLFFNTTDNINKMGGAGEAVDLMGYVNSGLMPNFKQFLEENPTIKKQIMKDGKIFYTPYFDGYNSVEKQQVMDVNIVKKVLATGAVYDTGKTNGGSNPDVNVLQQKAYEPFIDANYNYPNATTELSVSVNGEAKKITVNRTTNIIKLQNELLANGCTGKQLGDQLVTYLNKVFGDYVGENKIYKTLADIYISESAAYNSDELVALMRVVKANPKLISGDENEEIEIMMPRTSKDNNRVQNIMMMMCLFGIQGVDGETAGLFFDANGKINDAFALPSTYEGLDILSGLYDEGLILGNFYKKDKTVTDNVGQFFGKTTDNPGYGLMVYDFTPSQAQVNTVDENGIGTLDSKRKGAFKDTSVTGIMPVLPPITWWATGKDWKYDQALSNHTGMSLMRRSISNNTLKDTSWCIPASSDNKERAAILMDYLFSEEGVILNDFGPNNDKYWKSTDPAQFNVIGSERTPEFSDAFKTMMATKANGLDFWTFMRKYVGTTHGIGYVRTTSIKFQANNKYGKIGQANIEAAIADGVVCLDLVDKHGTELSYDNSVPSSAAFGTESAKDSYAAVTAFWAQDKAATDAIGWAKYIVEPKGSITNTTDLGKDATSAKNPYTYKDVKDQLNLRLTKYLFDLVSGYDESLIPDYVIALIG